MWEGNEERLSRGIKAAGDGEQRRSGGGSEKGVEES